MIARQTLNIYIQYLKNLPCLRRYSLVSFKKQRVTLRLSSIADHLSCADTCSPNFSKFGDLG